MAIEPEKHEDVGRSKFQCHSLTQTIFEMTQFKMSSGMGHMTHFD